MSTHPFWSALVDDAATLPPGGASLPEALAAHAARTADDGAGLAGTVVLRDTDLPLARGSDAPLTVAVTGGAGQLAGPAGLAARLGLRLVALEMALRDHDDLAGNARRVVAALDAARADGVLDDDVAVRVELPATPADHAWRSAAEVVAAAELRLGLPTGGVGPGPASDVLLGWIDAALDLETPFSCTGGLDRAVGHDAPDGDARHGFLNVLLATRALYDGTTTDQARVLLEERDPGAVVEAVRSADLGGVRRWFTSFRSGSVAAPWDDLRALGLAG
ncbi:hypothetical protein FE634_20845 [Nocardioides dongxiaopingii]|uniref:hypothetical protein n=1 Tax=Nocardioides sp. S-1144 TaxID=2582905 RepID=UPI00110E9537|nr:hypothetical protein [Nocardioides sp. S-1144]QCW52265.1 hypothetical protein FE634_20845 [Nocardioides sp. S-1144]